MIPAAQALERLKSGNRRFVKGEIRLANLSGHLRRDELVDGQAPIAAVLGCSDSRVPVEMVFDQGLGDLFVIRVAGNVVAPSQVGSVEFAAAQFGIRLVVVLGHTRCGAVQATLDELRRPTANQSPNLHSIVERIRPSVAPLLEAGSPRDPQLLMQQAVRSNVQFAVNGLCHGSAILEQLIDTQGLRVVGAEYALETGVVEFFDP